MSSNKTIAKNTLFLYSRMLLSMLVGLFTAGITLNVLGVNDFGVYNVVAGFVSMFTILNASMTQSTQRFLSFDIGRNDIQQLQRTFSTTLTIHFVIGFIVVLALETFGLWFINYRLNVPAERLAAINVVFQFSVLSTFLGIIQVPYNALITAHERFNVYAYISFLEIALRIIVLILIIHINYDKLILYAILLFCSSFIVRLVYLTYSRRNFKESKYVFYFDKAYFKTLLGFTGWSLYGQLSNMAKIQAITLLLNQMFNPTIVAARAIATTISMQVNSFSGGFNSTLYPPIIKQYSSGKLEEMYKLIYRGSKFSFFLMWVLALPVLLEMPLILDLWLKNPPEHTVLFSRLAIIEVLIMSISMPITAAARAPGKMKKYELILGTMQIGIFLLSWTVLHFGYPAYSVYIVAIITSIFMFLVRLWLVKQLVGLNISKFHREVTVPAIFVLVLSALPSYYFYSQWDNTILSAILVVCFSLFVSSITIYGIGLRKGERKIIHEFVLSRISKLRR